METRIYSGSSFERDLNYARAVVDGDWVHVSGTTGFDAATMSFAETVEEQAEQCFATIAAALAEAGSGMEKVVRCRVYVTSAEDFERAKPVLAKHWAACRPAATAVVCGLIDPRMKIEIEVTARR
ncbi:enamine deaminase RidA (YjgF/YER057c/UK114 family) [Constrictibacter sp. MBR-5]|jgi:enamine deaminase RidA (YjgF/YER057c/UK114 family)|uniref:RidA family protein n=1 Tax=Constrictibacter sp. MBR-5 TaxID=3156467 RepID=UPI003399D207